MTTRSRARKLPSSSSRSESDSESLDLKKIMDDDVLHNTPAKTSEDIMQKPNTNLTQDDAGVSSSDKARQSDSDDSVDKNIEATEESDIMQKDAPNDEATKSDSALEDNIMQKDDTNDKGSKSDSDSDDNIALADLQGKGKKTTGNKPKKTVCFTDSTASPKKKKKTQLSCKDCGKTFFNKERTLQTPNHSWWFEALLCHLRKRFLLEL